MEDGLPMADGTNPAFSYLTNKAYVQLGKTLKMVKTWHEYLQVIFVEAIVYWTKMLIQHTFAHSSAAKMQATTKAN